MDESMQENDESQNAMSEEQGVKMSQDELNELIRAKQAKAAEKARAEIRQEYEQRMQQDAMQQQVSASGKQQMGGSNIEDQINQALERRQQQLMEQERKRQIEGLADTYYQKMQQGKDLYEDFDKVIADFDESAFPEVVALVAQMDDAASIMYELAKNPGKLIDISTFANRSVPMAQSRLRAISDSIRDNREALSAEGDVPEPIQSQRPSTKAGADSGVKTVSDLRKLPYLRG